MITKVLSCSVLFLLLFLVFLLVSVDAKCLRCRDGQELACVGDSKFEFIAKCGAPDYSEEVGESSTGSFSGSTYGGNYSGSVHGRSSKIEKMMYNCGHLKFIEIVTVRGGRVTSIVGRPGGNGPVKCQ